MEGWSGCGNEEDGSGEVEAMVKEFWKALIHDDRDNGGD